MGAGLFLAAVVGYFAASLWVVVTLRRPSLPYRGVAWLAGAFLSGVAGGLALAGANGDGWHQWTGTGISAAGAAVAIGGWVNNRQQNGRHPR